MTTSDPKDPIIEFLKKDYELKTNYLTAHLTRMWQRFNFFIALESALSVALFGFFKGNEGFSHYAIITAVIGAVSSICWYIFGAQDRCLAALYRKHVKDAGEKIAYNLGLKEDYVHAADQTIKIKQKWYKYIYQWRSEHISTTKLAALFPLLVVLYWTSITVLISR
ncbi:MAG: hypothetical protein WA130_10115 [Candidatus Methanoperedens sp.]